MVRSTIDKSGYGRNTKEIPMKLGYFRLKDVTPTATHMEGSLQFADTPPEDVAVASPGTTLSDMI